MILQIFSEIKAHCPDLCLAVIECEVVNGPTSDEFWQEMEDEIAQIKSLFKLEEINKRPAISSTRKMYKVLGKDPNRYRPSAEALCRRIIRDIPIYKVSMLVDIINLVSIRSGFSIGGFDKEKVKGEICLGIGRADEEFEAIGRGKLNIEGLPVFRDNVGGIGTPTSDNERTKISDSTTSLLLIINGYSGKQGLQDAVEHILELLARYAQMKEYKLHWIE